MNLHVALKIAFIFGFILTFPVLSCVFINEFDASCAENCNEVFKHSNSKYEVL
jgi:hypothetical protein